MLDFIYNKDKWKLFYEKKIKKYFCVNSTYCFLTIKKSYYLCKTSYIKMYYYNKKSYEKM